MTTAGDIIVAGQNGTPARLALGSSGQVITSSGTSLLWADNSPSLPIATTTTLGGIKPDGTTITVDTSTGVASAMSGGLETGQYITNCILESYGDIISSFSSTYIILRAASRLLIPNGRNPNGTLLNIDYTFASTRQITVTSAGQADTNRYLFLVYNSSAGSLTTSTNSQFNVIASTTTPTISPLIGPTVDWFNPDDNVWRRTTNRGTSWTTVIQMPIARYDCSSSAITAVRGRKVSEILNNFDAHRIAGWPMPSDKHIDITQGASGNTYIAPADGWINIILVTTNTNGWCSISLHNDSGISILVDGTTTYASGRTITTICPIAARSKFGVTYNDVNFDTFRFIYAKGAL
jgi:hypothetical protein